ncbi:hypothetical protein GCM10009416_46260 [Craurococcus roseus]|uniref:Antitoxin FitA-like ribbon-helix-helix domain-containing protein n=1 Tax=Craurococcus roseus TaxID=77585 RepID=A0ABN1G3D2_9PROT
MAQVLVRDLPDETVARLKERAAEAGRSLEAELRDILNQAAHRATSGESGRRWPRWTRSARDPVLGGRANPRPPT